MSPNGIEFADRQIYLATASLEVRALVSFEFRPVLGSGEKLRELTVTVEQTIGLQHKRHS